MKSTRKLSTSKIRLPSSAMPRLRKILVPLDFSGQSRQALRWAIPLASQNKAKIFLVHVLPLPNYQAVELELPIPSPTEQRTAALKRLQTTAAAMIPPGLLARHVVLLGHAASQIVAAAEDHAIDLIVISTKGRSGLKRLLLGSTAEHVVRHARCPVLAIRRR